MMLIWRFVFLLFHGRDWRVRLELNHGAFAYPQDSLLPHQRQATEELLTRGGMLRAIVAVKRDGRVARFGVKDPALAQRLRNVLVS
jgi:hypothetical protein